MIDLDERIVRTLRERAEGPVDADRLLVGAVARGRTRVCRRRAAAGAALGVVALLGVGVAAGPVDRLPGLGPAIAPGRPGPAGAPVPLVPPRVDGAPGAAVRPDLIGKDPTLLHIGLAPGGPRFLYWEVGGGKETARLDVGGWTVTVELTSVDMLRSSLAWNMPSLVGPAANPYDGSVVHANGPEGAPVWRRYWQPAPGVYAGASVTSPNQQPLHDVAAALRLDDAYGCAGPLRLDALPPGAQLSGCRVVAGTFPAAYAVMLDVSNDEMMMWVELQYAGTNTTGRPTTNRTINGRPGYFDHQRERLELLDIPQVQLAATLISDRRDFTEAEAGTVLTGARVAEHLDQPATW
ncbi:hypothetical protein EAD89_20495 [Micromonospora sp. BL4]|uniref:hypothetical protein n=1 Tax=Micromonospora sp. BL4 TaxID=2478710 RepID=UPI000EF6249E|nr:hypothetical protein [Micromonospora sp. BL4]RLP86941.1 hypothetical protein EAD89_20495 [Micromonospora sp. BL4]